MITKHIGAKVDVYNTFHDFIKEVLKVLKIHYLTAIMYTQCPALQAVVDMCELSVQLWNIHECMSVVGSYSYLEVYILCLTHLRVSVNLLSFIHCCTSFLACYRI
jgi:hypothetical protein